MSNTNYYKNKPSQIKRFLKSKLKRNQRDKQENKEDFIIKYNSFNQNIVTNIQSLDQRRLIFVSSIGLYRTWKQCASFQLYTALIMLCNLKRKWIYNPASYCQELSVPLTAQIGSFEGSSETEQIDPQFIEMIKWKDSQGLVVWMSNDINENDCQTISNELVAPFWHNVSNKLQSLYDPITKSKYEALKLDAKWWENVNVNQFKFCGQISSILVELYFLTMKYMSVQEIMYQSNPSSLNPIISLDENKPIGLKCNDQTILDLCEKETVNNSETSDWWISKDYDPFELNLAQSVL